MSKRFNNVIIDRNGVIKKNNKRVVELYEYLDERGFDNHPKVIESNEDSIKTEYIESKKYYEISNGIEFIKLVANLHSKTVINKEVSKNKYRNIYDKISNNIEYLKEYYEKIISNIEEEVYMSPSHYLLAKNYSVIDSSLNYAKVELKKWFKMVENNTVERVSIIHNNLSLNHFIKGDKNYLISFDNYLVDTPILDLYKFYKKEGFKLDFKLLLNEYNNIFELLDNEKLLLYILISIPPKIIFIEDEYLNTINIKNALDYIYKGINIVK